MGGRANYTRILSLYFVTSLKLVGWNVISQMGTDCKPTPMVAHSHVVFSTGTTGLNPGGGGLLFACISRRYIA
jgi:hypothetical protein